MEDKKISDNLKLMEEWDWEENNKNIIFPDQLTSQSGKYAFWICKKGHHWQS